MFQTGHPDKQIPRHATQINQTGHPDKPYESSLRTDTCAKICKAAQKFPLEAKKNKVTLERWIVHMGKLSIGRVSEEKQADWRIPLP